MASITTYLRASPSLAILLLAALATTPANFAQSRFAAEADREQALFEAIVQEERANGPYSENLIGPLSDLALLYQDRGSHDRAIAMILRVQQVVRANEGLHSLEQIPLIQQLIANEEAVGRTQTAWDLEQDLLTLAKRHPTDMRTVPVFQAIATKRMRLLRHYIAGEFPPQFYIGCYYAWPRKEAIDAFGCMAGNRGTAIRGILSDAQENYYNAITVMLRNERYSSAELRGLELELLRSIEAVRRERDPRTSPISSRKRGDNDYDDLPDIPPDREPFASWWQNVHLVGAALDGVARQSAAPPDYLPIAISNERAAYEGWDYGFGRKSLERLSAYATATNAPLQEQARALIRIADWDLLYTQTSRALKQYQRAFEMLKLVGAQELIDELFAPQIPVVLPTLGSNPLAPDSARASNAYIDIAFEISRYGEGRRIEILDSTNATDADVARLTQLIQRSYFRPRAANDELARDAPVTLRYYLPE
jgi:hypothetical protein